MNSILKKLLKSSSGGFALQAVKVIQNLLWIPLFIKVLGAETYGEWSVVFGFAAVASISDLGIQVYWLNELTKYFEKKNREKFNSFFWSGVNIVILIIVLLTSSAFILNIFLDINDLLSLKYLKSANGILINLSLFVLLNILSKMFRGIFRSTGQYYKVVWFEVLFEMSIFISIYSSLLFSSSPLAISRVFLIISLVSLIYNLCVIKNKYHDWIEFNLNSFNISNSKKILKFGGIHSIGTISNILIIQFPIMIINIRDGAAMVTLFVSARTLSNLSKQLTTIINRSILPEIATLNAQKKSSVFIIEHCINIVFLVSASSLLFFAIFGYIFFEYWTDIESDYVPLLLLLLIISVFIDNFRMLFHDFLLGINKIKTVAIFNIVNVTTITLGLFFIDSFLTIYLFPIIVISSLILIQLPIYNKIIKQTIDIKNYIKIKYKLKKVLIISIPLGIISYLILINFSFNLFNSIIYTSVAILMIFSSTIYIIGKSELIKLFKYIQNG